jgi:pyruvate/2-oxoglutarate/acetoin dehydrogenase E1 component
MSGAPTSGAMLSYGGAIRAGFEYLLSQHPEVFVIGQGLWSPWYVGSSMTDLDKQFGTERIIDTPVSELACTGAAVGASLFGYRPVVVHPRMDFMLYGVDAIVNQAAKWSHMVGGQTHPAVTIRAIINRGGEQGAQHSQALHAWFAHIPGLRVVMPATPRDARDLLIASVLCDDPVLYIDDRWLYQLEEELPPPCKIDLRREGPRITRAGCDVTLVGSGYTAYQCVQAAQALEARGVSAEVVDLRVINPLDPLVVVDSVARTGRLCVVDGGWRNCGLAGEIIARVAESLEPATLKASPVRLMLPDAPAPTSRTLEEDYYVKTGDIVEAAVKLTAETGILVE